MADSDFGSRQISSISNNSSLLPVEIPSYELIRQTIGQLQGRPDSAVSENLNFDWEQLEVVIKKSLQEAQIKSLDSINQVVATQDDSKKQLTAYEKALQEERDNNIRRGETLQQYNQQQLIKRLDSIIKWTQQPVSEHARNLDQILNNPLSLIDKVADVVMRPIQNLIGFGANKLQSKIIKKASNKVNKSSEVSSGTESSSEDVMGSIPYVEPESSESDILDVEYTIQDEPATRPVMGLLESPESDILDAEYTIQDDPARMEREEGYMETEAESASVVQDVFEDPEGTEFGEFLDENLGSGDGAKSGITMDLGTVAIATAITVGILTLKEPLTNILNAVSGIISELQGPLGSVFRTIADVIKEMKDPVVNVLTSALDIITSVLRTIKDPITQMVSIMGETVVGILNAIKEPVIRIADFIGGNIIKTLDAMQPLVDQVLEEVIPAFMPFITATGNILAAIGNILEPLSKLIEHVTGGVVKGIVEGAKNLWDKATSWFTGDTSVDDAIITSDGKVIQTSPEDSIYAFKGDMAIRPIQSNYNSESHYSADSSIQQINQQYITNSPFPAFSPLAV